jgi:transposase-like protein
VLVDALFIQSRQEERGLMRTVLIVSGVRSDGYREILGVMVGDSGSFVTWDETFRWLRRCGLKGVTTAVSD